MAEQPWVWGSANRGSEGSVSRVGISQPGSSRQRGKRQPEVHRGGYTAAQGSLMRTTVGQKTPPGLACSAGQPTPTARLPHTCLQLHCSTGLHSPPYSRKSTTSCPTQ
jgi:hypothetical protein